MPTVSKKQEKFMQAVANNPKFAKKVGVNQSIGREFTQEKGMRTKKMMGGGMADRRGRAMTRMGADAAGRAMMKKGGKVKKGTSTDYKGQVGDILYNKVRKNVKKSTGPQKNVSAMTSTRMRADNKAKKGPVASRLYDAEEKMKNRYKTGSKNVKSKVMEMKKGGSTYKSFSNDLEELGRVDSEKYYTTKGKRNLAAEKKRVEKEIKNKKANVKVGYKDGGKVKKMNMGGATMGARGKTMADMKDMEGRAMAAGRLGGSPAMMADARGRAMKHGGAVMKAKGKKMAYGGKVKKMKHGGAVKSSASKRADGIAQRGRTRGRIV